MPQEELTADMVQDLAERIFASFDGGERCLEIYTTGNILEVCDIHSELMERFAGEERYTLFFNLLWDTRRTMFLGQIAQMVEEVVTEEEIATIVSRDTPGIREIAARYPTIAGILNNVAERIDSIDNPGLGARVEELVG